MKRAGSPTLATFLTATCLVSALPIAAAEEPASTPEVSLELRVSVAGRVLEPEAKVEIRRGESLQLGVALLDADAAPTDITRDLRTDYVSITPWSVVVDRDGRVTAASAPEFARHGIASDLGSVAITFGRTGDQRIGARSILFQLID